MHFQQTEMATPEHVVVQYRLAGLGSRFLAQLIDVIILGIIFILLGLFLVFVGLPITDFLSDYIFIGFSSYIFALVIISVFVLMWGYFALFEFFTGGQTPGKMAVGIRVIQEGGQSITFLSAFIRNVIRIIDLLPSFYLIGMVVIFFHPKHKRLGDLVGGTIVVYDRKTSKKKRKSHLEQEIQYRGITSQTLSLEPWALRRLTAKEWTLLSTYIERRQNLKQEDKMQITFEVAEILLPRIGLAVEGRPLEQVENDLFALYLILKEEYSFT